MRTIGIAILAFALTHAAEAQFNPYQPVNYYNGPTPAYYGPPPGGAYNSYQPYQSGNANYYGANNYNSFNGPTATGEAGDALFNCGCAVQIVDKKVVAGSACDNQQRLVENAVTNPGVVAPTGIVPHQQAGPYLGT